MKKCLLLVLGVALLGACAACRGRGVAVSSNSPEQESKAPEFAYVNTGDVRARQQLVSGWYAIEEGSWRWMAQDAAAMLAVPSQAPIKFDLKLFFPPEHMKRAGSPVTVSVVLDGHHFAQATYDKPGAYELLKPVPAGMLTASAAKVEIHLDRAATPGGDDKRVLGAVVQGIGFRQE